MAWGVQKEGGDQLTVWETFKVYDGQIHAVEAFMRICRWRSATVVGSKRRRGAAQIRA
jgi:L-ascorbate metabolism protein UlaG (beta-lactamase superfamily)